MAPALSELLTDWVVNNRLALAESLALSGGLPEAFDVLSEARKTWHPGQVFRLPDLGRLSAVTLAAAGRVVEAIDAVVEASDLAERTGSRTQAIFAVHSAVRYGAHGQDARLRDLGRGVDSPRSTLAPQQADAWDRGDAATLGGGVPELRVRRRSDLCDRRRGAGRTDVGIAGRQDRATEARLRIRRLQMTTGSLHTPAIRLANLGSPLSRREAEVALLIPDGHADREIAQMLGISTRTAEGHARRIYEKLGVKGRDKLHQLFDGSG